MHDREIIEMLEHIDRRLDRIERIVLTLVEGETEAMAKLDDIAKQIDDATTALAGDITALQLKAGDVVTADQVTKLQALADKLTQMGKDASNPASTDTTPTPATGS